MEKEFVPYELALRMKQLGFDEPCLAWFSDRNIRVVGTNGCTVSHLPFNSSFKDDDEFVSAPTFSQAFRWFRDKYSMYHQIHKGYGWEGIVRESNNNESILWHDGTYNSPEEVERACLTKLIEIVEQKEKEL